MTHAPHLVQVAVLLVNLTGLALVTRRAFSSWLFARAASPVLVAFPFFLEHFFGLGSLAWLWPLSTALSLWILVTQRQVLRTNWRTECLFLATFAYAFSWQYAFPDIDASSEKITDISFVANYFSGKRLPPVDHWLPPFNFDMYYALQHYAAALMGRILAIPMGVAYHLAICVLVASTAAAAGGTAWLLVRRRMPALILTVALIFGGTGVAPLIHSVMPAPALYSSIRFMGSALTPLNATRPFGQWLLHADRQPSEEESLDLPVELFSYLVALGDYHPPLGGYLLLMLALLSIALIESGESVIPAHIVLGATIPLTLATNSWDFPLQAFLAASWILYRTWLRKPVRWKAFAVGMGVTLALLTPFLVHFVPQVRSLHTAIKWVRLHQHTPPVAGLLVFYPVLAILTLHLFFGERSRASLAFCAICIALLVGSELFYVDDVYWGKFERFNTALKWWAWIYSATLLMIGAFNLRSSSRVCRWGTILILALVCTYAGELGRQFFATPKRHLGELDGTAWIRDDPEKRAFLKLLGAKPPSIVLQHLPDRAYTAPPALAIFAGHTALLGWPNHEDIWRGYRPDVDQRFAAVNQFYAAELPDPTRWLEQNNVEYVVWLSEDGSPEIFEKLNLQIHDRYSWTAVSASDDPPAGVWTHTGQ